MENQNSNGKNISQAIIENVFILKDGSLIAGSNLISGTIKPGDKLYYNDCTGREGIEVTVAGLALPGKGGVSSISAGDELSNRLAIKIMGCRPDQLHTGHLLQSEPEEVIYHEAPGWDAISRAFEKRYPGQTRPAHFGTYASFKSKEAGPLDGISVYNGGEYLHFVTYGLSELYEKQNGNPGRSGYGFELTLKLKKAGLENMVLEVRHMCSLLQMVSGITVNNGHQFFPGQYLAISQQKGYDVMGKSALTGFVTKEDELGTIESPFGKVQLIQLVGITTAEMESLKNQQLTPVQLLEKLPDDLTDYARK
ncbi:MAG: suppressor of fused domain protein [Lachnospiraceae bacterium]|nr:suppressor of fused domain protein [Lachnospiraceae bacterium]